MSHTAPALGRVGGRSRVPVYTVARAAARPELEARWDSPVWDGVGSLELLHFRPEGSSHRPRTLARLLYDGGGIYGIFVVEDRFVRSIRTRTGEPVYRDSCVEIFVEPRPGRGYLNFEFNCGGALLATHVLDPARTVHGLGHCVALDEAAARSIRVASSQPRVVDPEIPGPVVWTLEFFLPVALFERYAGAEPPRPGAEWRGNLYKCGDETSRPHWASWSPLDERNFHLPRCFGTLRFA